MTVRMWQTRNDANYNNRHAECCGIEFFAFPHQSLYARDGKYSARVGNSDGFKDGVFTKSSSASVWLCNPDGSSTHLDGGHFPTIEEAIEWAAKQIIERTNSDNGF